MNTLLFYWRRGHRRLHSATRQGFSLLEVLVSLGILVGALAGIAAILPATGARLNEATASDRASTLIANALADVNNRGLLTSKLFSGVAPPKAVIFGEGLTDTTTGTSSLTPAPSMVQVANKTELEKLTVPSLHFLLQDDLVYSPPTVSDFPTNSFDALGLREFKRGLCVGVMLAPLDADPTNNANLNSAQAAAGMPARLSIVVFRKPSPDNQTIPLTYVSPGLYQVQISGASSSDVEATRKKFLPGCGAVLALPSVATKAPRWFRIGSSWTTGTTSGDRIVPDKSYVSFSEEAAATFAPGNLTVVAFEGLLQLQERMVQLK